MNTDVSSLLGHSISTAAVLAALAGWLPAIGTILATLAAFIWYSVQVYESKTVQRMIARRRHRRVVRLRQRIKELEHDVLAIREDNAEG